LAWADGTLCRGSPAAPLFYLLDLFLEKPIHLHGCSFLFFLFNLIKQTRSMGSLTPKIRVPSRKRMPTYSTPGSTRQLANFVKKRGRVFGVLSQLIWKSPRSVLLGLFLGAGWD